MNQPINCIIVEDNRDTIIYLETILRQIAPDIEVLASFRSVSTAIAGIRKHRPDLIFLDVELIGGTAFDVLEEFPVMEFGIIFTTDYNKYGAASYDYSAIDYVLKPIEKKRLSEAVAKFRQRRRPQTRMWIKQKNGEEIVIRFADIIRIEMEKGNPNPGLALNLERRTSAARAYTVIQDKRRSLDEWLRILPPHLFFRAGRNHIINLSFVDSFERDPQVWSIALLDGQLLCPLPATSAADFQAALRHVADI